MGDIWPIIKTAFWHCVAAIVVGALFAGAAKVLAWLYPHSFLGWWIGWMETLLLVAITTALAVLFINAIAKLVYDAVKATWSGLLNVIPYSAMAE
jgi:hypothetical protein